MGVGARASYGCGRRRRFEARDQVVEAELLEALADRLELAGRVVDQRLALAAEVERLAQAGLARVEPGDDLLEPLDGGLVALGRAHSCTFAGTSASAIRAVNAPASRTAAALRQRLAVVRRAGARSRARAFAPDRARKAPPCASRARRPGARRERSAARSSARRARAGRARSRRPTDAAAASRLRPSTTRGDALLPRRPALATPRRPVARSSRAFWWRSRRCRSRWSRGARDSAAELARAAHHGRAPACVEPAGGVAQAVGRGGAVDADRRLGGVRRRRAADGGDVVDQRAVDVVADRADHRHGQQRDRAAQAPRRRTPTGRRSSRRRA